MERTYRQGVADHHCLKIERFRTGSSVAVSDGDVLFVNHGGNMRDVHLRVLC